MPPSARPQFPLPLGIGNREDAEDSAIDTKFAFHFWARRKSLEAMHNPPDPLENSTPVKYDSLGFGLRLRRGTRFVFCTRARGCVGTRARGSIALGQKHDLEPQAANKACARPQK